MKRETKLISGILISTAACIALIAGLTFSLISVGPEEINTNNTKYTLTGKVVNNKSQAIADARVTILSQSDMTQTNNLQPENDGTGLKTVITDKNGRFKIENVPPGTYTHKVEAEGYKTFEQQVTITENKSLTIRLEPSQLSEF